MTELIFKKDIDEEKLNTLLNFLNSWGVEVEVQPKPRKNLVRKGSSKKTFSLSVGLWDDYAIDGKTLRNKSWNKEL
ncbi:MAG: hypothetical protein VB074_14465 [Proteiniphilum sp.]|jgi:hypothetical protein|uniref:hypothetical protein n=1 Tax=Proteiniphilum sp. TaxID=1926877 RepID=UPI002B218D4D|nr:hypothetical protein [Proteiniphilum sp.]MEA5129380.1 hypothetical protein [Proteiniphilum sp.]